MWRMAIAALLLTMCAASGPRTSSGSSRPEPGATRETALEVCGPEGEREYLRRLRCADGATPTYARIGSFGMRTAPRTPAEEKLAQQQALDRKPVAPGQADYHVLDKYEVRCAAATVELFMDMYHCEQPPPAVAPEGFTLAARP